MLSLFLLNIIEIYLIFSNDYYNVAIMTKKEIGKALQNARNNANMTCVVVSKHLGNSEKTVSAWEQGNGQPDVNTLIQLCKICPVLMK